MKLPSLKTVTKNRIVHVLSCEINHLLDAASEISNGNLDKCIFANKLWSSVLILIGTKSKSLFLNWPYHEDWKLIYRHSVTGGIFLLSIFLFFSLFLFFFQIKETELMEKYLQEIK